MNTGSSVSGEGGKMTLSQAEAELANARDITPEEIKRLFG